MRFRQFKRFAGRDLNAVISWLINELNSVMRELYIGLSNLAFKDNFKSFQWSGSLAVSEEKQITHPIGSVPSGYIIFKQVGDAVVDAGVTAWTNEVVYLRNNNASNPVTITVIFFA